MKRMAMASAVFFLTAYPPLALVAIKSVEASRHTLDINSLPALVRAVSNHGASILGGKAVDVAITHFAGDAFYYFTVAHRSVAKPYYTYDGTYPTNGFHPLWQYVLTRVFSALEPNQDAEILFVFGFNIIAVAAGAALFSLALEGLLRSAPLAIIGAVPGVYALALAPASSQHATWGLINGMESSLSVLLFGILSYLLLGRALPDRLRVRDIVIVSTVLTLLTLSRLDDIFLFAPFLVLLFVKSQGQGRAELGKRVALASAIPSLLIGAYLLNNLRYAGLLLPVSGRLKFALALGDNISIVLGAFVPLSQAIYSTGPREWQSLSWRALQIVVPAAVCLAWILRSRRSLRDALRTGPLRGGTLQVNYQILVLAAFAAYVIIKAAYNLTLVDMWSQGSWYFPISLMLTSLFSLLLVLNAATSESTAKWGLPLTTPGSIWSVSLACLFVVLLANFAIEERRGTGFDQRLSFWRGRESISREVLLRYDGQGLLEFADGIMGYALSIPTLGGIGLTLDKEAIEAKEHGGLLDLAYRRGFRAFSSLTYFTLPSADDNDSLTVQHAAETFFLLGGQGPERWKFRVIYRDPESQAVFVAFSPK